MSSSPGRRDFLTLKPSRRAASAHPLWQYTARELTTGRTHPEAAHSLHSGRTEWSFSHATFTHLIDANPS
jgi:hypothetical protein